jgi:hypothetical protein
MPVERPVQASPLKRGLIDRASEGADVRAAGEHELERTDWVDHAAGVVRIPIEAASDAVVADPKLITAQPSALSGANAGRRPDASTAPGAGESSPAVSAATSNANPRPPATTPAPSSGSVTDHGREVAR